MADNVTLPGTGSIIASDDVGGAQYQIVKVGLGAANAVDGHLDAGQTTMTNSLPVVLASDQSAIPITDNSSTISVDDGAGSLTVDGTVAISGTVAVTDNSSTLSVDDGAGSLTIDGSVGISRKTYTYYTGTKSASGDNTVVSAPAAGNRIVVAMIEVQNTTMTATTVILKNGSTSVWTHYNALQGDALAIQFNRGDEWLLGDAAALVVNLSGANSHNVNVAYYTEAV